MPSKIEDDLNDFGKVTCAYLFAVTGASMSFTLMVEAVAIIHDGGFEVATTNDVSSKALDLVLITILVFIVGWFSALVTAAVPFTLGIATARWLKVTHWVYFVVGACITAVALSPLYISIPNLGINVQAPEPSFIEKFRFGLPYFLASGSFAGAACAYYLRRSRRIVK